jgi:hypothetical protein
MAKIWHLRVETVKRRKKQNLPPVEDSNDLPDPKQADDFVSVCVFICSCEPMKLNWSSPC